MDLIGLSKYEIIEVLKDPFVTWDDWNVICAETHKVDSSFFSEGVDLKGCDFSFNNLSQRDFKCFDFTGSSFDNAILKDTTFYRCTFDKVSFEGCDLSSAHFVECEMSLTSFATANLAGVTFIDSQIYHGIFDSAYIQATVFDSCTLTVCDFYKAYGQLFTFMSTFLIGCRISPELFIQADPEFLSQIHKDLVGKLKNVPKKELKSMCSVLDMGLFEGNGVPKSKDVSSYLLKSLRVGDTVGEHGIAYIVSEAIKGEIKARGFFRRWKKKYRL